VESSQIANLALSSQIANFKFGKMASRQTNAKTPVGHRTTRKQATTTQPALTHHSTNKSSQSAKSHSSKDSK
jgi:hypothetical protein